MPPCRVGLKGMGRGLESGWEEIENWSLKIANLLLGRAALAPRGPAVGGMKAQVGALTDWLFMSLCIVGQSVSDPGQDESIVKKRPWKGTIRPSDHPTIRLSDYPPKKTMDRIASQ